jgi:hypothetical protein
MRIRSDLHHLPDPDLELTRVNEDPDPAYYRWIFSVIIEPLGNPHKYNLSRYENTTPALKLVKTMLSF